MVKNIVTSIIKHKIASTILLILLVGGGYLIYSKTHATVNPIRYVLGAVEKGSVIVSVTGTGQVSASNQIDIKSKASGDVTSVQAQNGQEIAAGTVIAYINARDAQKAVRDAEVSLASAKLSLAKIKQPADQLTILQAENTLARNQESKQRAQDDIAKTYEDAYNDISNAFLSFPDVMTSLYDIMFNSTQGLGVGQANIDFYTDSVSSYDALAFRNKTDATSAYEKARAAFDRNFTEYKATSRLADIAKIDALLHQTYGTAQDISEALKSMNNVLQFYKDKMVAQGKVPSTVVTTHLVLLNANSGTVNTRLSSLLGDINTIQSDQTTIIDADRSIAENTASLEKLKAGADALDIQSAEISVQQRENALRDAQEKLADYTVKAPFDGTLAVLSLKKTDSVLSGTTIATLITKQKIATISLNEVDATKIKVGQKATLTFDAVDGLSITGQVASVDTLGTVSQGVVSYAANIAFDTQDDRIKPGMSTSAAIIIDSKQDILIVPNGAIKSQGASSYVEVLGPEAQDTSAEGVTYLTVPTQKQIQAGIVDDTNTEIVSGLQEGDKVIVRTISAAKTNQTTTQAPSLFGAAGGRAGGGGNFRVVR
jgi:RND family efflux transporter MFP subunit